MNTMIFRFKSIVTTVIAFAVLVIIVNILGFAYPELMFFTPNDEACHSIITIVIVSLLGIFLELRARAYAGEYDRSSPPHPSGYTYEINDFISDTVVGMVTAPFYSRYTCHSYNVYGLYSLGFHHPEIWLATILSAAIFFGITFCLMCVLKITFDLKEHGNLKLGFGSWMLTSIIIAAVFTLTAKYLPARIQWYDQYNIVKYTGFIWLISWLSSMIAAQVYQKKHHGGDEKKVYPVLQYALLSGILGILYSMFSFKHFNLIGTFMYDGWIQVVLTVLFFVVYLVVFFGIQSVFKTMLHIRFMDWTKDVPQ